jgi:uncharacterized membrane protein HdeD (DUF308 family)
MQASIFLAKLLGPLLLLPGIGLVANQRAFRAMATQMLDGVLLVYVFGLIDLTAGLAILLVHNVWVPDWRVLITLIGWLLLIRGAVRVLIPETVMGYAKNLLRSNRLYLVSGIVLIILGLVLCYFGYIAR